MQSGLAISAWAGASSAAAAPQGAWRPDVLVRAAGGVIMRSSSRRSCEVAVVHRPRRFDWSFPKGKVEPGESLEDAAQREVLEETGLFCSLDRFVGRVWYRDRKDRPKVVAYWTMSCEGGSFTPNEEVDDLRWLDLREASALLTYDRDRQLLATAAGWRSRHPVMSAGR